MEISRERQIIADEIGFRRSGDGCGTSAVIQGFTHPSQMNFEMTN